MFCARDGLRVWSPSGLVAPGPGWRREHNVHATGGGAAPDEQNLEPGVFRGFLPFTKIGIFRNLVLGEFRVLWTPLAVCLFIGTDVTAAGAHRWIPGTLPKPEF